MKKTITLLFAILGFIVLTTQTKTYSNSYYYDELIFESDTVGVPTAVDTVNIPTVIDKTYIKNIKLFPNPSTDYFTINIPSNTKIVVDIYSIDGVLIKQNINNDNYINVSDLKSGLYIINVIFNNTLNHKYKLIKN